MIDSLNLEPTTMHLNNEDVGGLWQYGITCPTDSIRVAFMFAPYPVQPGHQHVAWYLMCGMGSPLGLGPGDGICTHTDTAYVVPAGTFRCYRYHQYYDLPVFGEFDVYLYMAPGVGIVAYEFYGDTGIWKKHLASYSLQ
jgi:hypothetical protein